MKTGLLINARCGSKRLHDKHLIKINGKFALSYLIERLLTVIDKNLIWIATGLERENALLELVAKEHGIHIYYGNPDDIPVRHYDLMDKFKLEAAVSIDGDDLLTSPTAVADCLEIIPDWDLVRTAGLPYGMNVLWGYTLERLKAAIRWNNNYPVNDTGWGWIFDNPDAMEKWRSKEVLYDMPGQSKYIRATLDEPRDLEFFKWLFTYCPKDIQMNDVKLCEWILGEEKDNWEVGGLKW